MKCKFVVIIILTILNWSCNKEDNSSVKKWKYIIVGDNKSSETSYYYIDTVMQIDTTINGTLDYEVLLKINKDTSDNIKFIIYYYESWVGPFEINIYIQTMKNSYIAVENNIPIPFNLGDTINSRLNFKGNSNSFDLSSYYNYGYAINDDIKTWNNQTGKYSGFRIIDQNDTIYGWIKLEINNHSKLIIKDYAFRK